MIIMKKGHRIRPKPQRSCLGHAQPFKRKAGHDFFSLESLMKKANKPHSAAVKGEMIFFIIKKNTDFCIKGRKRQFEKMYTVL